ncbi:hypothetical protein JKF63_00408 [Porcisia hertigi]|uniref:Uncharacterized protein n=1 Tax=Porcisia hertigi TaxID=2761500 RepID=A0A836I9I2_9TRYP|nr:hypothetical protein JKF63_00408 [Porcisia hertigi]
MQAAGITDETNSGAVRVNGILMSLTQCAAYLQELTHRALTLPYASQRAPLADQMLLEGEERGDAVEDGKSISSPIVQVPSPVSPNELAKGAEVRAKKRARSRSPSPHARSITSAPPATELLSGATRLNCSGEPATVGRGNEKRNKVSPSSSPSGFFKSVRTPAPLATAGVQVEAGPSQPLAVPITNQQQHGGDTQSFYDPVALIAATEAGESSSLLPQNPADPRTDTGSVSTASKRDVPLADGGSAPRENALSCTIFASPTMRQRRIVSTLRARAAGGGPTSPVAGAQHAPPASHTSPHVAPRTGTFTMPFAFGHPSAAPFIAGGAQEEVNMVSGKNNSAGVYRGTWCDSGGWSTYSSRFWLAHTHAVSRAFEVMPAPRNGQSATTKDTEPLCNGDADEQRASAAASAFLPVSPTNSETAAAVVRMALRSHWRQRSSIWTAMEDSLRMAVGSGHLRGDALEAGVHALQASEEEHRRYNGMDAEGDERGSNLGASCGMTRSDVGWVTHGAEQRQASSFPACPPRALLPVSGKAVVEAQGRIADTDERGRETDANAPRYIACGGGIPSADRIVIDHTYSTRGSYVMAPHVTAEGTTAPQCHFLTLQRNPQEDLHCHVYKHVMPTDMRVAVEAEDSLTIEPHSVAPVHVANGKFSSAYNPRRDQNGGECDDEGREDSADDSVERKKVCRLSAASRAASRANPAAAHIADVSRGDSSADIDYVLRNHPSIRRIPMPDVELRYGP